MSKTKHTVILHPLQRIFGETFNPKLFINTIRRSLLWMFLIMLAALGVTYLFLRYTVPIYQTSSTLIVKSENPARALNIETINLDAANPELMSEVEVIRSNVILQRVIEQLPVMISYYRMGDILDFELYRSTPFQVNIQQHAGSIFNTPVYVSFPDKEHVHIQYTTGTRNIKREARIGQPFETPHFTATIAAQGSREPGETPSELFNENYYFTLNNTSMLKQSISQNLDVKPLNPNAGTIRITYRSPNRQKAADIANAVAEEYIKYDEERKTESSSLIMGFLDEQLQNVRADLSEIENRIKRFKIDNKFVTPENEEDNLLSSFREIEQELAHIKYEESSLNWLEQYIREKEDLRYISPMMGASTQSGSFSNLIESLADLQDRKNERLLQVTPQSPAIQSLNRQIEDVRSALLESIENARATLSAKREELYRQMNEYEGKFTTLPEKEAHYIHLKRLNTIQEKFYLMLLERRSQFAITKAGFVSNNVILETASAPADPIYPNKGQVWLLGAFAGLALSVLLLVIRYMMHHNILSMLEVEQNTHASILGIIPTQKRDTDHGTIGALITKKPKSTIAEAFRSVRTNLQFIATDKGPKTMVVTSTISGEGKTFIAVNLGIAQAMVGKKVIILDFDMRKPRIHEIFNASNTKGLSTILINKDKALSCIQQYTLESPGYDESALTLDYITAGPIPPNPSELILSKNTDQFIETLKTKYDLIIFDTPPVGLVADGVDLLKHADYPIYILRADYSSRDFINNINRLVAEHKIARLSIILNDVGKGGSGYGYSYGYGYGYGYGEDQGYYANEKGKSPRWKRIFNYIRP